MARSLFSRVFADLTEALDRRFRWHRLPVPLSLLTLVGLRMRLRESNLHDTSPAPADRPPPSGSRHLTTRTVDGTFNDLENPTMGSAGTRFGRNVPVELTFPENEWALLRPNPRTVSRELLTRHEFQPATTLNLLAAAWLQFMIRDWFQTCSQTLRSMTVATMRGKARLRRAWRGGILGRLLAPRMVLVPTARIAVASARPTPTPRGTGIAPAGAPADAAASSSWRRSPPA